VASAVRLVRGLSSAVYRYDGELVHNVAVSDATPEIRAEYQRWFPRRPRPASIIDRAILERSITHIADIQKASDLLEGARRIAAMRGYHSILVVPMLREGVPIGAISVTRVEAGLFSDKQIALFQTFADQAVIAIENVRLFTELQARNRDLTDALEQQTATAEILRVISQAQTDVQPVFDAIVRNAVRLCGASHGGVYRFDGELVHSAAHDGYTSEQLEHWRRQWPRPVTAASVACQVIRTGRLVRIADLETAAEMHALSSDTLVNLRARGARSVIAVPMFRQHEIVGAISLSHRDVDAFSDAHVELLKTFADQAVIAVENARLLTELQTRTRELTRSVGELTALGDVGRTLSSTLDLETVLQTIVTRANTLAGTAGCTIWEYDDAHGQFHLRVSHYADERDAAILGAPHRVTTIRRGQGVTTQVVERRQPVQIADIALEGAYESPIRGALLEAGHRGLLGVPLLREEQVIGVLAVTRKTPGEFEPDVVRLLSTFATQSALAIQNARLFREIEDKSRQLEIASQHKSEFLANMSHELRTPLNAIIGFSEVLGERMFGELNEKQDEYLKDIHASGQHLLSLINDILDLSKIEAGRMELELTDFNLPATLDNALTLVRERAGRHGIALHITVDERVGQVRADERKIRQVALNLLSNAIKFTPEGGRIDVRAVPDDGGVEVSVSDTGVGIAPEDQEAIFEEFRQVGTAAKKVEGTGLGLALSRRFVELHGGRIWVKSEVGVGSTFSFTIPVRRGE
jgi:two-component system, NtrC family, sensor kinase